LSSQHCDGSNSAETTLLSSRFQIHGTAAENALPPTVKSWNQPVSTFTFQTLTLLVGRQRWHLTAEAFSISCICSVYGSLEWNEWWYKHNFWNWHRALHFVRFSFRCVLWQTSSENLSLLFILYKCRTRYTDAAQKLVCWMVCMLTGYRVVFADTFNDWQFRATSVIYPASGTSSVGRDWMDSV